MRPNITEIDHWRPFIGVILGLVIWPAVQSRAQVIVPSSIWLAGDAAGAASRSGDRFGEAIASGDFNGDGFADLAVGSPSSDAEGATDSGEVVVFFGTPSGLSSEAAEVVAQSAVMASSSEVGDGFGAALAAGDFDGDGFDDLVVGVPFEDTGGAIDTGAVAIIYGSPDGLLPSRSESISQASLTNSFNEDGDQFGASLAAGDFDRDGYGDVAVGIVGEDAGGIPDIGMVAVLFGSASGLLPARSEVFSQASLDGGENEEGDQFGCSLSRGDFDADGFDDLAVGIPLKDISVRSDSGEIGVFFGSREGLLVADSQRLDQEAAGEQNRSDDNAGYSLAAGDFDGDGYDDLVAGVPYNNSSSRANNGIAMVFFGSGSGLLPARALSLEQSDFGGVEANSDEFGAVAALGDFDANGLADLALAAPGENLNSLGDVGAVYVGTFADSDGDGLADIAETGSLGTDPMRPDTDGDGMGDGAEISAGTDPLDPRSNLRVVTVGHSPESGQVNLSWSSVPGRRYRVERRQDLSGAAWLDLTGDDPITAGVGTVTSFVDWRPIPGAGRVFYRIRLDH